jgi:hypothetical protein
MEGIAVEVRAVRRICEGIAVCVMRGEDENRSASARHTMKFLHRGDEIGDMLDEMLGPNLIERVVPKRKSALVKVAEDIGGGIRVHVDTDRSGKFCWTAPDVEGSQRKTSESPGKGERKSPNRRRSGWDITAPPKDAARKRKPPWREFKDSSGSATGPEDHMYDRSHTQSDTSVVFLQHSLKIALQAPCKCKKTKVWIEERGPIKCKKLGGCLCPIN